MKLKFLIFSFLFFIPTAFAAQLSGSTFISITSDTAVNAKNIAMNDARRQIVFDVVHQYANTEQLKELIQNSSDADLTNLGSSVSIEGEKQSNTTYNANIIMALNLDGVRDWLTQGSVQNWLPNAYDTDRFVIIATLNNPVDDISEINSRAETGDGDVIVDSILGNQVTLSALASKRTSLTISLQQHGWKFLNQDNVLKIWK